MRVLRRVLIASLSVVAVLLIVLVVLAKRDEPRMRYRFSICAHADNDCRGMYR